MQIAVVGANGQVGTELCLFLGEFPGVEAIPICRSSRAAALLEFIGVPCRVGSLQTRTEASHLLDGCDAVIDLSLSRGLASDVRAAAERVAFHALEALPSGAPYLYASTLAALGMTAPGERLRWKTIAGSVYGANKRQIEAFVRRHGKRSRRPVYILRFGQVHGEMQSISRDLLSSIGRSPVAVPTGTSYAVFVYSIAEAVVNIVRGLETPGTYTLTSEPQWSWSELYRYYVDHAGMAVPVILSEYHLLPKRSRIRSGLFGILNRYREFLASYVLPRVPRLEMRAKAVHLMRTAAAQVAAEEATRNFRPFEQIWLGDAPGRRLKTLSDSRRTMEPYVRRVRARLQRASARFGNVSSTALGHPAQAECE